MKFTLLSVVSFFVFTNGEYVVEKLDREAFLEHTCSTNNDCPRPFTVCNTTINHCDCKVGYVGSPDRKYCLPVAHNLNDSCEYDNQCTHKFSNSTCSGNTCKCRENYHFTHSECWKDVGFGEKCSNDRECHHIYGYCSRPYNVCTCDVNKIINPDKKMCLDIVAYQERCLESVQCTEKLGAADCVDGLCFCAKNHHFVTSEQKCIPMKSVSSAASLHTSTVLLISILFLNLND